jgi:hypothetical protein
MADTSSNKDNNRSKPSTAPSTISKNPTNTTQKTEYSGASSGATRVESIGIGEKLAFARETDPGSVANVPVSGHKTTLLTRAPQAKADGPASGQKKRDVKVSDTPATDAGKAVVKMPKPHSRTAIGQISQKLKSLPSLCIVDLTFKEDKEKVDSRKIRRKALEAWLKEYMPSHPALSASVERQPGVVRLIFHVENQSNKTMLNSCIEKARSKVLHIDGKTTTTSIDGKFTITWESCFEDTANAYKKSLDLLLRQTSYKITDLEPLPLTPECNSIFDPVLPGCLRSTSSARPSGYRFHLRHRPSADVSGKQLKVDFDVVPCIPSKDLAEVLLDMVGRTGLDEHNIALVRLWLPTIRNSLRGVNVRCTYVPGRKTPQGRGKAELLDVENMDKGRAFQIQDIRLPAEIPTFDIGQVPYTIYKYFTDGKSRSYIFSCFAS